jgi:hypothetical protein
MKNSALESTLPIGAVAAVVGIEFGAASGERESAYFLQPPWQIDVFSAALQAVGEREHGTARPERRAHGRSCSATK